MLTNVAYIHFSQNFKTPPADHQPGSGPCKITPNHTECQQITFKAKNGKRKQEGPKDKHITSTR